MSEYYETLLRCRDEIQEKTGGFRPHMALILGSGLGNLGTQMELHAELPYREISGFPVSSVAGHAGKLLFGYLEGVPLVCMQGRVHYYEGFDIQDVVLPTRVMGLLGADRLMLTNAAGTVDPALETPSILLIRDHILLGVPNPLRGANIDELGVRFPDMTNVYDEALSAVLRTKAEALGLRLYEGVYVQLSGPSFETPAEVRMLGKLGGSAVGMSTACEAVAARHMGMRVCGLSCLSNKGAGLSATPLSHEEVFEAGKQMETDMTALLRAAIRELAEA